MPVHKAQLVGIAVPSKQSFIVGNITVIQFKYKKKEHLTLKLVQIGSWRRSHVHTLAFYRLFNSGWGRLGWLVDG